MICKICGTYDHETDEHYLQLGEDPTDTSDPSVEYMDDSVIDLAPNSEYYSESTSETPDLTETFTPPPTPPPLTKKQGIATDFMTLAQASTSGDSEIMLSAIEKFSKSQLVRFLDVSVLGPLLLFWAYRGKLTKGERLMLGLIGAGTMIYNGKNYLKNKKILQPKEIEVIQAELTSSKLSG